MTRSGRSRVAMMVRYPRAGAVKTRIAAAVGDVEALRLHDRLSRHCLARLMPLHATGEATVEVRIDAPARSAARRWLGAGPEYRLQGHGDLGERLRETVAEAFADEHERVVVVGSDCPRARAGDVRAALAALDRSDAVFGPAEDGGYWLVAVRRSSADRALPTLFDAMPWGTRDVLERSESVARAAGLAVGRVRTLPDVDLPSDIGAADAAMAEDELATDAGVSVVIPAFEEAAFVGRAVEAALAGGATEVIVVDGGSSDDTSGVARRAGARVLVAPRGRASQMNAGAQVAIGPIVLFTHADTALPPGAAALARASLTESAAVAGAFDFALDERGVAWRLAGAAGRARFRVTGLPYGDQGLFLRTSTLADLGGFPEQPCMEDYELALRLRRLGRIVHADARAISSARDFRRHGLVRSVAANAAVIAGYRLGIAPERLVVLRRRVSDRAG